MLQTTLGGASSGDTIRTIVSMGTNLSVLALSILNIPSGERSGRRSGQQNGLGIGRAEQFLQLKTQKLIKVTKVLDKDYTALSNDRHHSFKNRSRSPKDINGVVVDSVTITLLQSITSRDRWCRWCSCGCSGDLSRSLHQRQHRTEHLFVNHGIQ